MTRGVRGVAGEEGGTVTREPYRLSLDRFLRTAQPRPELRRAMKNSRRNGRIVPILVAG
ncbi:hypothetical protein EV640_101303 [Nesterenkonia aurantiaca]|uniref:Uncharacterized protein n=1 Tax=Nesterenkonia aurantiaca TaxID=1436010 RepID=A0A4R7G848_9MICC|nr:hypothetical protein EV640_101303 [Nesterenkonia aurantiaca]